LGNFSISVVQSTCIFVAAYHRNRFFYLGQVDGTWPESGCNEQVEWNVLVPHRSMYRTIRCFVLWSKQRLYLIVGTVDCAGALSFFFAFAAQTHSRFGKASLVGGFIAIRHEIFTLLPCFYFRATNFLQSDKLKNARV